MLDIGVIALGDYRMAKNKKFRIFFEKSLALSKKIYTFAECYTCRKEFRPISDDKKMVGTVFHAAIHLLFIT